MQSAAHRGSSGDCGPSVTLITDPEVGACRVRGTGQGVSVMHSIMKVAAIICIASSAFRLGIHSVSFGGTALAWTALASSIVTLVAFSFVLLREPWKAWAK